ncbi:MAG TPA: glycosyltransferase, partial [Candidatus Lokiarchaeia archaeon]
MRKKIKVCQVTTIPFAIRFLLLNQIKDLQKQGYDVSVVCSPGRWVKEIEEEGVPVKTIKITRKMSPFSDLITLIKLVFYFRREKFDIVHTSMPKPGLLGAMAARMARVPIVIHSNLGFYFQKDSHWLKRKFFLLIEKTTAKCCDLVFSVAKSDINLAIKEKICPSDKIKYLGGWVDLNRFNPNRFNQEFIERKKRELKIDNQAKVIGINARLVRDKGYYELFKAFGEVLKKFPQALLLIIGPEEPEKRDRINPDLVFKEF